MGMQVIQPYATPTNVGLDTLTGICTTYASGNAANTPGSGAWFVLTARPGSYGVQVAFPVSNSQTAYYLRYANANGWQEWRQA